MAEGDEQLQDLYRDVLLDYFRSGGRKGSLESPDFRSRGANPLCGDEIELTASLEGARLKEIRHAGRGCVISQASAAMMAQALEGKTLSEARAIAVAFKAFLLEGASPESLPPELDDARSLGGVRKFPVRIKCALLGWNTLLQALQEDP
jgi:nitrogen fixation NifU-like protein